MNVLWPLLLKWNIPNKIRIMWSAYVIPAKDHVYIVQ